MYPWTFNNAQNIIHHLITEESERFRQNLMNPKWVKQQLDNGIPQEAITIFRIFGGLDEKD